MSGNRFHVHGASSRAPARPAVMLLGALFVAAASATGVAPTDIASPTPSAAEWSRHDLGRTGPQIRAVVAADQGFVGVGASTPHDVASSGIWASTDGLAWTVLDEPRAGRSLIELAAHDSALVAISASPAGFWMSDAEGQWTQTADADAFGGGLLTSVASNGKTLVVAGGGQVWTSTDGRAFEEAEVPIADGNVTDVVAGGPGFVAVGSTYVASMEAKALVWLSRDGRAWEAVEDDEAFKMSELRAVGAHDGRLVATGWFTDAETGLFFTPSAWTSDDGTAWSRATVVDDHLPDASSPEGALEGAVMMALARGRDGWIAAGTSVAAQGDLAAVDAAIWTSNADGTRWERVPHEARFEAGMSTSLEFGASSVAVSGDRAVVIGRTEGPQTTSWISPAQAGGTEPSPRGSAPPPTDVPVTGPIATPAPPVPAPPSVPSGSLAAISYEEYWHTTCAAWDSLIRAVGNPETAEGSELSRALDAAVEARDGASADELAAEILTEITVGREHLAAARAWQPGERAVSATDGMFAAFEVMTEAKRAVANEEPGAPDPQRAFEEAGGIEAWYAIFEALEETRAAAGSVAKPCPNVPLMP